MIPKAERTLLCLEQAIVCHNSVVEHLDEVGTYFPIIVYTLGHDGARPSTSWVRSTYHETTMKVHECTMCVCARYGHAPIDVTFTRILVRYVYS